jgi:hydroxymethylpyrimidine/phosphomethylpyrimidine kinase
MTPNVLSIAGLDPSGGAGVLADVKTISACGCYGMAAVAALTAQNTRGVFAIHSPPAEFIAAQIDAIFDDIRVDAVKIGMLGSAEAANVVADRLSARPPPFIVLDPVLAASSGDALATDEVVEILRKRLLPIATLVTPNLAEAAALTHRSGSLAAEQINDAAARLLADGAHAVLIKGGHEGGAASTDRLFIEGSRHFFSAPRIATKNTHGTGCALASAIACELAKGQSLLDSVSAAKRYLTGALRAGGRLDVGTGQGPLDHFWRNA